VLVAVGAGVLASRFNRARVPTRQSRRRRAAATTARRSVAVLGFKNLSQRADAAWLSTAFSEMLTSELGAGEKLRMIPGEQVVRMKIDLALADAEGFAKDTLTRIRKNPAPISSCSGRMSPAQAPARRSASIFASRTPPAARPSRR
jgi:hypothetical protein